MAGLRTQTGTGFKMLLSLACVVVIVAGLRAASELLIPIMLGFFLAILSLPILKTLERWGVPRPLAVGLTIAIDTLVLSSVVFLASSVLPEFQSKRAIYAELLRTKLIGMSETIDAQLAALSTFATKFTDSPNLEAGNMLTMKELFTRYWDSTLIIDFIGQTAVVGRLTSVLSKSFFVLVLMIFVLAESGQFASKFSAVLRSRGPNLRRFQDSGRDIQRYLGIKTAVSAVTGILAWFSCTLFGVDFPVLWGLVAFVFNFIPAIGSILAAIPPVVLALLVGDTIWPGVGVLMCYLVINMALGNFIEPMLLGNRFGISTVVVILSVLFWGYVWGPVGMFLAVPLTMVVKVMLDNSNDLRWVSVLMGKESSKRSLPKVLTEAKALAEQREGGDSTAAAAAREDHSPDPKDEGGDLGGLEAQAGGK